MTSIAELIRQFQQQHNAAREANEQRYRELRGTIQQSLDSVRGRFAESMQLMESLGQDERSRLRRTTEIGKAVDEQDLINRGLGSTTILTGQRRRRDVELSEAEQSITDQVSRQRAGALMDLAGLEASIFDRMAGAIESRSDVGPDFGQLAALIQQASQDSGGGQMATTINHPGSSLRDSIRAKLGRVKGGGGAGRPQYGSRGGGGGGESPGGDIAPRGGGAGDAGSLRAQFLKGGQAFLGGGGSVQGDGGNVITSGFWKGKTEEEARRFGQRYRFGR